MLDKFFCASGGALERRKKDERREFCSGASYTGCSHIHEHAGRQLGRLHASLTCGERRMS